MLLVLLLLCSFQFPETESQVSIWNDFKCEPKKTSINSLHLLDTFITMINLFLKMFLSFNHSFFSLLVKFNQIRLIVWLPPVSSRGQQRPLLWSDLHEETGLQQTSRKTTKQTKLLCVCWGFGFFSSESRRTDPSTGEGSESFLFITFSSQIKQVSRGKVPAPVVYLQQDHAFIL